MDVIWLPIPFPQLAARLRDDELSGCRQRSDNQRQGLEACRNGNSRYQNTIKPSLERLGGRQPLGISGGKVDDQAEHGLVRERTMADSEAPDLDRKSVV